MNRIAVERINLLQRKLHNDSGKSNIAFQAGRDTEKDILLEKRRAIRPTASEMEIMKDPRHNKMKDCKEDLNFADLTSGKGKRYLVASVTKPNHSPTRTGSQ